MSSVPPSIQPGELAKILDITPPETPFPWQERLLDILSKGSIPSSLDLPTGLGKTSVMALWLLARIHGAPLPRRLVYVVDRRVVVDQATDVAVSLRRLVDENAPWKNALGLAADRSLPISTLRGQHVDNRAWMEDPASPAIIIGTVDMIGSRLLFEGYGVSRKLRPYQAGLLGVDALFVLDESHLVPAFERLLTSVEEKSHAWGMTAPSSLPPLRVLTLSATARSADTHGFRLSQSDAEHPVVRRRLYAKKNLIVEDIPAGEKLVDALVARARAIHEAGGPPRRLLIYCDLRSDAEKVARELKKRSRPDGDSDTAPPDVELFVGGRRVRERQDAARRLAEMGFLAGPRTAPKTTAILVATSAAEVGVDLDADDMLCDVVPWERMVQRLGRVNRRGEGRATVRVLALAPPGDIEKVRTKSASKRSVREAALLASADRLQSVVSLIARLPAEGDANVHDASPAALRDLARNADHQDDIERASTPRPLYPPLRKAHVEAWSLTTLREHPGRPEIQPWLRGWKEDAPQTTVVWRQHLPATEDGEPGTPQEIEAFFEAAPPHTSECLEALTSRVQKWLLARTKALAKTLEEGQNPVVAIALEPRGTLRRLWRLGDLHPLGGGATPEPEKKRMPDDLAGVTLIVPSSLGGLESGLLDDKSNRPPRAADDGQPWIPSAVETSDTTTCEPVIRFRVRESGADETPRDETSPWRERYRWPRSTTEEGEVVRWLLIEKWRHDGATEEDRSTSRPQLLEEHLAWTETRARRLAKRLSLPEDLTEMLATAARIHDLGKKAPRWQKAFNAPRDGTYAKTRGPLDLGLLDGYRHELGSILMAMGANALDGLSPELQELALHLVAAHHGRARPSMPTRSCDQAPPSLLEEEARDIALRFAHLQEIWGPWGLAWWEALLRAADQQASRDNDLAQPLEAMEAMS